MPGAIVLLLRTGLLMLSDSAARIFGGIDGAGEAELSMAASNESVYEESGFIFFKEDLGTEKTVEVLTGLFVDLRSIGIDSGGKVDLGPDDVQVTVRQILRERSSLRRRDHVVRRTGDVGRMWGMRSNGLEGMYETHAMLLAEYHLGGGIIIPAQGVFRGDAERG